MAILKVRDEDGNVREILVIRGKNGVAPKKGVDYYTEEEKTAFGNEVLAALPAVEMVATLDDGTTQTYQIYGKAVE